MKARDPFKEFLEDQKPARVVTASKPLREEDAWEWNIREQCYHNIVTGEKREELDMIHAR